MTNNTLFSYNGSNFIYSAGSFTDTYGSAPMVSTGLYELDALDSTYGIVLGQPIKDMEADQFPAEEMGDRKRNGLWNGRQQLLFTLHGRVHGKGGSVQLDHHKLRKVKMWQDYIDIVTANIFGDFEPTTTTTFEPRTEYAYRSGVASSSTELAQISKSLVPAHDEGVTLYETTSTENPYAIYMECARGKNGNRIEFVIIPMQIAKMLHNMPFNAVMHRFYGNAAA